MQLILVHIAAPIVRTTTTNVFALAFRSMGAMQPLGGLIVEFLLNSLREHGCLLRRFVTTLVGPCVDLQGHPKIQDIIRCMHNLVKFSHFHAQATVDLESLFSHEGCKVKHMLC